MPGGSVLADIKARLSTDAFEVLQACSRRWQRGEVSAEDFYALAVDLLAGDAELLMRLVALLPNQAKREAIQAVHDQATGKRAPPPTLPQEVDQDSDGAGELVICGGGDLAGNLLWRNADGTPLGTAMLRFHKAATAASRLAAGDMRVTSVATDAPPTSTPWPGDGHRSKYQHKGWCADLAMHQLPRAAAAISPQPKTPAAPAADATGAWPGRRYYGPIPAAASERLDIHIPLDCPWQHSEQPCWLAGERAAYPELFPGPRPASAVPGGRNDTDEPEGDGWTAPDFGPDDMEGDALVVPSSEQQQQQPGSRLPTGRDPLTIRYRGPGLPARTAALGMPGVPARQQQPCRGVAQPREHAPLVLWWRRDLRLQDNPALAFAAASGRPVIHVFVWAPHEMGGWAPGAASRAWLHASLGSLSEALSKRYQSRLLLLDARRASSLAALQSLVLQTGAVAVAVNRLYEPWCIKRDSDVQYSLAANMGVTWRSFNASLLYEPWDAAPDATDLACWNTGYGSVRFFRNGCMKMSEPPAPSLELPPSMRVFPVKLHPPSASLAALQLVELPRLPRARAVEEGVEWKAGARIDWVAGIRAAWRIGEAGAQDALAAFLEDGVHHFETRSQVKTIQSVGRWEVDDAFSAGQEGRGGPPKAPMERFRADRRWTARISPHMAWGELGPRQVYHAVVSRYGRRYAATFLRRLAWRDLSYWALWRFPWMPDRPLRPQYEHQRWAVGWGGPSELRALSVVKQRWDPDEPRLRAWQRGDTGFPLVDAAMRELWATGYMPNYLRHVVAGFLVEYLNIDWRHGQLWFHDTLVDADVAINAYMWQNGGHSGMDQWNFVMHPVYAVKAADPEGTYVRHWLPALAKLPLEYIHQPWEAPITVLAAAGVRLGRDYPKRIVQHLERARSDSLAAVVEMRKSVGRAFVLPDGNDALPLPDGRFARCITRVDYREEADEPITKQAAADRWDTGRRPLRGSMAAALHEPLTNSQAARNEAGGWSRVGPKIG